MFKIFMHIIQYYYYILVLKYEHFSFIVVGKRSELLFGPGPNFFYIKIVNIDS